MWGGHARVLRGCALVALAMLTGCTPPAVDPGGGLSGLWLAQPGVSRRASTSGAPWAESNEDTRVIDPGRTLVVADLDGPGVITHIWNTVASQELGYSRLLVLRMYWDDEEQPSVEAPLGDFFGVGHGLDLPVNSGPVRVAAGGARATATGACRSAKRRGSR